MADFIGATVVIALINPPEAKVRGLIVNIKDQQLILNEVSFLHDGTRQASLAVDGSNVLDLDIEPQPIPDAPPASTFTTSDPAILSYARPSTPGQVSVISQMDAQHGLPPDTSHPPVSPLHSVNGSGTLGVVETSAILTEPFNELSLEGHKKSNKRDIITVDGPLNENGFQNGGASQETALKGSQKARKENRIRPKGAGTKARRSHEPSKTSGLPQESSANVDHATSKRKAGPGLQQNMRTPLLNPDFLVPKAGNSKANKRSRKQKQSELDDQNGWATGEVSDIQDLGDFDFEENHKRFDKKKVFEQIRRDDTTADEERLVSFNKLPARPGTHGGKNLHHTENVLDSPKRKIVFSSDSDSGADESRRNRSRFSQRGSSRASERKVPSRKGSALAASDVQVTIPAILPDIREIRSLRPATEVPVLSSNPSLRSERSAAQSSRRPWRTAASDLPCRYVTPLQMLELEHLATSELGIAEDVLTENAATVIAQTARKMVKLRGKRGGPKSPPMAPLIVVLAGNHRTGSRAIAAARQLRNHDATVLVCVMGLEREEDLLDNVRRQVNIFQKCQGRIVPQNRLMDNLKYLFDFHRIESADQSADLVVDALLGMHLSFEDLRMEDQASYSQLVQWANNCNVITMSIDVPSGVDASTGQIPDPSYKDRLRAEANRTGAMLLDSPSLVIEADHVLSLGAPKIGLLLGKESLTSFQNHSSWLVADIGLDESIWKKSGLSTRRGVDFGGEWVTKLELIPGSD